MKALPWVIVGGLLSCSSDPGAASASPTAPEFSGVRPGEGSGERTGEVAPSDGSDPSASAFNAEPDSPANGATEVTSMERPLTAGTNRVDESQAMDLGEASASAPGGEAEPMAGESNAEPMGDPAADTPAAQLQNVLVFTRTTGYRHDSIGAGVTALEQLGQSEEFDVRQTEQPADFNDEALAQYDVVVWLSTTLDVLNEEQQAAFERYIQAGGGWVGVHAASDTEYDWAWYGGLIGGGAWFADHPNGTPSASLTVDAANASHGSTQHLPARFEMQDEWYNFQVNPAGEVNVLLRLDESTYNANDGASGAMGADHPIAWFHEYDGGRAWYTGLGHRSELYRDPRFVQHLLGGLRWAAGVNL